jgi:hypothetical protein
MKNDIEIINENALKNNFTLIITRVSHFVNTSRSTVVEHGLVIIVDISGFTKFVFETELTAGQNIVSDLLLSIINANKLNLNIAEIEGDAVFFYRFGNAPSQKEIIAQYEEMLYEFFNTVSSISEETGIKLPLSIKMIAHYGDIAQYQLKGFDKLYGKVVTEAHLLLKNDHDSHSYVLMTDDYLNQVDIHRTDGTYLYNSRCEILRGAKVCYSTVDYSTCPSI